MGSYIIKLQILQCGYDILTLTFKLVIKSSPYISPALHNSYQTRLVNRMAVLSLSYVAAPLAWLTFLLPKIGVTPRVVIVVPRSIGVWRRTVCGQVQQKGGKRSRTGSQHRGTAPVEWKPPPRDIRYSRNIDICFSLFLIVSSLFCELTIHSHSSIHFWWCDLWTWEFRC